MGSRTGHGMRLEDVDLDPRAIAEAGGPVQQALEREQALGPEPDDGDAKDTHERRRRSGLDGRGARVIGDAAREVGRSTPELVVHPRVVVHRLQVAGAPVGQDDRAPALRR